MGLKVIHKIGAFFISAMFLFVLVGCSMRAKDGVITMVLESSARSEVTQRKYIENVAKYRAISKPAL